MKKTIVLALLLGMALVSCNSGSRAPKSEADSLAYAVGVDLGTYVKSVDSTLNVDMVAAAMKNVIANRGNMTLEEAHAFLNEYFGVRKPAKNLKASEEFLAEMEKKPNVQKTESGLLYEVIEAGSDVRATQDADTVVVVYTGMLPDGTVFDSTEKHGTESDQFPLNAVIPAWTEGMKLVGEGGTVKIYAHPDMAYGQRGAGQIIGPNQALIFEVKVVNVRPAAATEE